MNETLLLPNHMSCEACGLNRSRTYVVPGRGNTKSPLVFVGEAPGREEDQAGQPFIGKSGKLLREIIDAMPLMNSEDYFFTNTHHCRPPNNDTAQGEAAGWSICPKIWLTAELQRIKPKVIIATGATACHYFRPEDTDMPMRWHVAKDTWLEDLKCWVVGAFHPSYVLRQGVNEGTREGNKALVSLVASLQRAMYYLMASGICQTPEVPEITEALETGAL